MGQSVITKVSNLFLKNRRIEFTPIKPYASLHEARLNFSETDLSFIAAAGPGLEPRYHASEACVLPLDDPAKLEKVYLLKKHYSRLIAICGKCLIYTTSAVNQNYEAIFGNRFA